jgi:hypothetical protein
LFLSTETRFLDRGGKERVQDCDFPMHRRGTHSLCLQLVGSFSVRGMVVTFQILARHQIKPTDIDILVVNCSLLCVTPV